MSHHPSNLSGITLPSLTVLRALALCVFGAGVLPSAAEAQGPLVYEGLLTDADDSPVEPFPVLRFSIVDAEGFEQWAQVVDPDDGPVARGEDGRFVVVLDDGELGDGTFGPPDSAAVADGAGLVVARCETAACANEILLGDAQPIAAVPVALLARDVEPAAVQRAVFQMTDLVVSQNPGPGQFASLSDALAAIEDKALPPGRGVAIRIERGVYEHDAAIHFSRPDGALLKIVGAGADVTMLRFPTSDGVIVDSGARLGLLDDLSVVGGFSIGDEREPVATGLFVKPVADAVLGAGLVVRGFPSSCIYIQGGRARAEGVTVTECGYSGLTSGRGGVLNANGARISNVGSYCGLAASGATIECEHCECRDSARDGFYAIDAGHIRVRYMEGIDYDSIVRHPFAATHMGMVFAFGARDERALIDAHSHIRFD